MDRRSARALYERALADGTPAALLEDVRGQMLCLRATHLPAGSRWTVDVELTAARGGASSFLVLGGNSVVQQATELLQDHGCHPSAGSAPLPRAGLLSPAAREEDRLAPKELLRQARSLLSRPGAPSLEVLTGALEALETLCDSARELPRVARLKYEAESLLRAAATEGSRPVSLDEWLVRLQAYLDGASHSRLR